MMKRGLLTVIVALLFCVNAGASEDNQQENKSGLPPGMKASMITVEGIVEKVFAIDDNGTRYRAYQVKWRDYEVIVSDPLGTTDYQEGDQITFMVSKSEFKERNIKTFTFMVFNVNAFKKQ